MSEVYLAMNNYVHCYYLVLVPICYFEEVPKNFSLLILPKSSSLFLKDPYHLLEMSPKNYSPLRPVSDNQLVSLKVSKMTARGNFLSCRWRCFKKKSVGLLLYWSFSAFVLGNYALRKFIFDDEVHSNK